MALPGRATGEGTRRFRDRAVTERGLPMEHFRSSPDGLELSSLGLGTYIGAPDNATDEAVTEVAGVCLSSGRINVLDTAINYRYQRAERSVGRAVRRVVDAGEVQRDEVFVATKVGYFAPDGESSIRPDRWVEEQLVRTGVLDPNDIVDGCHAMSPTYLEDQFGRSRKNLGLETVDLLYAHNAPDAQIPSIGREKFLERLGEAFARFEGWRDRGWLGSYGLATWESLRGARSNASYLSLESAVRVARRVGGDHHGLRYVQFPFNLAMPEAWTSANQPVGGTLLPLFAAAPKLGVGCFSSVPLLQGKLARAGPRRSGLTPAQTALQFARSVPGTQGPMVGQKRAEHLAENLELAQRRPWDAATFTSLLP